MAPCRSMMWISFSLVLVLAPVLGEQSKGCQKAQSAITKGRVSDLIKGIKRSTKESDELDCEENSKKSKLTIQQAAVSAIPGRNENKNKKKKSTVASDSEHNYLMLPNHEMNVDINVLGIKRNLNKPTSKSIRKSPLWSLSKLIEEVDSHEAAKKKNATPLDTSLAMKLKSIDTKSATSQATIKGVDTKLEPSQPTTHKSESSASAFLKANLATDPSTGIKATLSKAIEKVEKVIASRNANMITPNKASTTVEDTQAKRDNGTEAKETSPSTSNSNTPATKNTTTLTGTTKKKVDDPYAEIAAGPDRPKIPQLKTDNSADNEGPVMKLNDKETSKQSEKGGPPLTGQHDIGGLLDRLTDKLNKGGGGIASDEAAPLDDASPNNVKYMQSSMGLDDSAAAAIAAQTGGNAEFTQDKQMQEFGLDKLKDQADHMDVEKMTEQDGLLAGNSPQTGMDSLTQSAGFGSDVKSEGINSAAALSEQALANTPSLEGASDAVPNVPTSAAIAPSTGSLETGGAETIGAEPTGGDDGVEKSLSKASSMTTSAIMDVLKNAKLPNAADFSNADISAGPDPYAGESEADNQGGATSNDPLAALLASKTSETPGLDTSDVLSSPSSFGSSEENSENSNLSDMTGDTRSTTGTSPDYEYQRNRIPVDTDDNDSYENRYNTELFKRNVIMRPKRDSYVSPFHGKEAYDTAI